MKSKRQLNPPARRYFTAPATGFAAAPTQTKLVIIQLPTPF
jgi:hypothetical protein